MPNSVPQAKGRLPMLLLETDPLLRRTVALTARAMGLADVHEAGSPQVARRMIREHAFRGAVIALDFGERQYNQYDLSLIDEIRDGENTRAIPIAVLVSSCDAPLLQELRLREVTRVILKPFRARTLLDTFAAFQES